MTQLNSYQRNKYKNHRVAYKMNVLQQIPNSHRSLAKDIHENTEQNQQKISQSLPHNQNINPFQYQNNQFLDSNDPVHIKYLLRSKQQSKSHNKNLLLRKRIQTEHKSENIPQDFSKKQLLLPLVPNRKHTKRQNTKTQPTVKLKDLYQKKIRLQRRLKILSKQLLNLKVSLSANEQRPQNPQIKNTQKTQQVLLQAPNRSISNSNKRQYVLEPGLMNSKNKKNLSPVSIQSVQKNREVISFIQKMHEQSVARDLKRIERHKRYLQHKMNHVCVDCARSKCQMDIYSGILSSSVVS